MPRKERNEKLEFTISRTNNKSWSYYKNYHYLTESLPSGHYYELTLKNKKVGFISISRFPHPKVKDIMNISRIVIVPEFQGFNLGLKFMKEICLLYNKDRIRITTSLKPFIKTLEKSLDWKCVRFNRVSSGSGSGLIHNKILQNHSMNRITASFEFIRSSKCL